MKAIHLETDSRFDGSLSAVGTPNPIFVAFPRLTKFYADRLLILLGLDVC